MTVALTGMTVGIAAVSRQIMSLIAARQVEILSIAWMVLTFSIFYNFQQARMAQKKDVLQKKLQHKQTLMEAELETAHSIQQAFLNTPPQIPGYDIAAKYETAGSLGGDFYHFFQSPNHLGVVIGDVSGHGLSSALVMALIEGIMDEMGLEHLKPHQVLKLIDQRLKKFLKGSNNYVTLMVGLLNLSNGQLEYASAGHPPLLHFQAANHQTHELPGTGSILGIFDDNEYETQTAQLQSGDRLLFYTDGLYETRNSQSDFFGSEKLQNTLVQNPSISAFQALEGVYTQIHQFSSLIQDDRAAILIKKN